MEQSAFSRLVRVLSCVTVLVIFVTLAVSLSLPGAIAGPSYVTCDKNTMIWTVSPSGGDDTKNLQYAFDQAVRVGPGGTVALTAGQFYCNNIVVTGFDGTFRGAGKGVTRIDTLRGLNPNAPPLGNPIDFPSLFVFVGGNVRISDMTIEITPFWTTVAYGKQAFGFDMYLTDAMIRIDGRYANSLVERVQFIGHEGPGYYGSSVRDNVHTGLRICDLADFKSSWGIHVGPTTGTHIVRQCEFTRFTEAVTFFGLSNGRALVGGSVADANTFVDTGIMTRNIEGSVVEISYNNMFSISGSGTTGVFCYNDIKPQEKAMPVSLITSPSQVFISHNTIEYLEGAWTFMGDVIYLDDDGPSIKRFLNLKDEVVWSMQAVVSNNKIYLDFPVAGIYGFGVQDAVVTGNTISGAGIAGVSVAPGPYGYYGWLETCSHWTLSGNNFENFDAEVAQVWLGPFSDHCTVVGGGKDNVWDQGKDNLLVGVNNMGSGVSVGDEVSDAMAKKHDFMKSLW
jgi:hypothetical protein